MSFLERPIGEMDLEELVRLMKQVISQEVPPIPAGVLNLDDLDNPLVPPDGAVQAEALVYNAETGKWENGRITADSLEANLVLTTSIIAGNYPDGAFTAMGEVTHDGEDMVGIHAFDEMQMLTFMLNASDGSVFLKGRVQFGDSFLQTNNAIDIQEQVDAGFETPARVQNAAGSAATPSTDATASWPGATASGNLLLACLYIYDTDGTVPAVATPADWTLAETQNAADSDSAMYLFYIKNAASRSGAETIPLGDSCRWVLNIIEYSGADDLDATTDVTFAAASSHPWDAITSTQAAAITAFQGVMDDSASGNLLGVDDLTTDLSSFRHVSVTNVNFRMLFTSYDSIEPAAGTFDGSSESYNTDTFALKNADSIIIMAAFQAKVAGTMAAPEAGAIRLYSKDVSGEALLHVKDEAGVESSLALANADTRLKMEVLSVTNNFASIGTDAGVTGTFTVPGVEVGDAIIFCGQSVLSTGGANGRAIIFHFESPATTADEIEFTLWNASPASAADLVSKDYQFLVIHQS